MNWARKLLLIVIFGALISSMVELYFFLVLPLHVIRDGDFEEGTTHWSTFTYYGNDTFDVSLEMANDFHNNNPYRAKLTLARNNTVPSPNKDDVWFKIFQTVPTHPFTETTTVSLRLFIAQPDLELLVNQSDAVLLYIGFMLGNQTEKHFCVYGWVIKNSDKIKITNETFKELKYWTILNLEEEISLAEEFEFSFEKNVWQDVACKDITIDRSWQIHEGVELGFMMWNLWLNETQTITVKLGRFDITYIWPISRLSSRPENITAQIQQSCQQEFVR